MSKRTHTRARFAGFAVTAFVAAFAAAPAALASGTQTQTHLGGVPTAPVAGSGRTVPVCLAGAVQLGCFNSNN